MNVRQQILSLIIFLLIPIGAFSISEEELTEKHVMVAMRMIGHEVLMSLEDCESRVMPIERMHNQYIIPFEKEFEIDPDEIVSVITGVIEETQIATHYFAELKQCETKEIAHSFEVGSPTGADMQPCKGRTLPKDCYQLVVTVMDGPGFTKSLTGDALSAGDDQTFKTAYLLVPGLFILGFLGYYIKKKNPEEDDPSYMIRMGATQFDKRNMVVSHQDRRVELSSKESELLAVLHASANEAIQREAILREVWGDDGDYVGRTLDVFISKLRKKLETDVSLKIVNIRGVGYKLVC